MNPLTNVRNVQKMNERELELGLIGKKSWHDQYKDSAWIFIGGLPYDLTEGDVIAIFSQYGELVNINLVRDGKTGKSKGFCFLCYEDQRSTVLAVDNLNGIKVLGRIIRVDHVENYKVPKEHGDEDEVTKKLRMEGIAPKPEEEEDDDDYVVPMKKDKSKKEKKMKKKKKEKKKKQKEKLEDYSDSEDKSAKHRKLKSHHSEKDKPHITGTNSRSEYSTKDTGYRRKEHSVNERNYSANNLQDDRRDRSDDRFYHRKESHTHEDRYRNDHKRRHDEREYYSNREYRQESEQSDRRHKYDHVYRDRR